MIDFDETHTGGLKNTTREEIENLIGKHVMFAFDSFYKDKTLTSNLTVPILLPHTSDMPSQPMMTVTFQMPVFAVRDKYGNLEIISMAKAYGWEK